MADGWKAGAKAMFEALVDRGYISDDYCERAKKGVSDILRIVEDE